MDYRKIDDLLERYWKMELTDEEEAELKVLLKQEDLPERLQKSANLFKYYQDESTETVLDNDFDKQLWSQIEKKNGHKFSIGYAWRVAAALVFILIASFLFIKLKDGESVPAYAMDTYEDPETAYLETKKTLIMLSRQFYKGEVYASQVSMMNEAMENIGK